MKILKKKFLFILIIMLVFLFALPVFANSPPPADHLTVVLSNLPDDAVYVDLLVKISQDDPNFVDFQSNVYSDSVSKSSGIVSYSDSGFYSFTFHYKDSRSNIKIEPYYNDLYYVDFCNGLNYQDYLTQYENLLNNYRDVKIALIDKDFNVIFVSHAVQLPKVDKTVIFDGELHFDFDTNCLEFDTRTNSFYFMFISVYSIFIMLLSITTETVTSLLFGFRSRKVSIILIVNVCTQIIMRLLFLVMPFTYLIKTIILELFVYTIEFLIYKKTIKDTSTVKIMVYTITANTLSLLLGIFIDSYFYFPI